MNSITYALFCVCVALLLSWTVVAINLVYLFWLKPKRLAKLLKKQGIDGPPYELLYGNTREFASMSKEAFSKPMALSHDITPRVAPFLHETMNRYGKVFVIWYGNQPRVAIFSPDLVKEIFLNKSRHFHSAPDLPTLKLLATGLITYNVEKWAFHRGILMPGFRQKKLKQETFSAFSSCCIEMIRKWEKLVGPPGHYELEVSSELRQLLREIICKTIYGANYAELQQIFKLQEEQAKLTMPTFWEMYFPILTSATKTSIRRKNIHAEVTSRLMNLINKRLEELKMGNPSNDSILDLMLDSYIGQEDGGSKKAGMLMEDILEECRLFTISDDTTSALVTWTLVALSMHPGWQDRARDEVLQLCGKQVPTFDSLIQLKIVTMIVYEVLRLYPSLPMLHRRTVKSVTIGSYSLPAGVEVLIPILFIHRDQELWGNDSEKFNPERFSGGVANASKHQLGYLPFGGGPRICIGQAFAITGAKLAVAMILQHFSFELSPSYVHAPCHVATVQPQHGAHLIFRKL